MAGVKKLDDLRSGKINMWPYAMRELPVFPVQALRAELYVQETPRHSSDEHQQNDCILLAQGPRYYPAFVTRKETANRGYLVQDCRPRSCGEHHTLQSTFKDTKLQQHVPGLYGTSVAMLAVNVLNGMQNTDSRRGENPNIRHRYPQSSSGERPTEFGHGQPYRGSHVYGNLTECPLGCGEELRVHDLVRHQASLCGSRFVDCLMLGCGTVVQARKMDMHFRQDCLARRKQHVLAAKGKIARMEIYCDACGEIVPRRHMRTHLAHECCMRKIKCSRPSYNTFVTPGSLSHYQRSDECEVTKHNNALIEVAAHKISMERCSGCQLTLLTTDLREHLASACPMRLVNCPNRELGCDKCVRAAQVAFHLRENCVVQINRRESASRHASRRELMQCSGCGYTVTRYQLINHQRTKCPNRRVRCKHWDLGCRVMLRLSAMAEHLKVDCVLDARACLVLDGGKAYVALDEADCKPPWTAELWIWRPGLVESTREKARMAIGAYWEFHQAREKLAIAERRLVVLEPLFTAVATTSAKERSKQMEDAKEKLSDEMLEAATLRDDAKVDLVVSSVVLSNTLAAATRGVEELSTKGDLHGLDRLALASTPWYAVSSNPRRDHLRTKRHCITIGGNGGVSEDPDHLSPVHRSCLQSELTGVQIGTVENLQSEPNEGISKINAWTNRTDTSVEGARTEYNRECASGPGVPSEVSGSSPDAPKQGRVVEPTGGSVSSAEHLEMIRADESSRSNNATCDRREEGEHKIVGGRELCSESMGQLALIAEEDPESECARSEASFWAEWVALRGPSLAKKLLHLSNEILPQLKKEIVVATGLATEFIFRQPNGSTRDVVYVTENKMNQDDDNTTSTNPNGKGASARKAARKAKRRQKHEQQFGKKLETRIAEEVRKRGGAGTLFGSDKVLFNLEMGPNDHVGIKIAGKADHIFNYRCPRKHWVHLAFVCNSTGVILFENGRAVSRIPDITLALPMREIGGREMAGQCLLQEVRYWNVDKSKQRLAEFMHRVLPATAISDGLVGYWTFEEGSGEFVNDVTEQRFRSQIVGKGIKWTTPELMSICEIGQPPTPSWREKNVCKVELRRARMAQRARLHSQFVSCPTGCSKLVLQKDIRAHMIYECDLRLITCSMASCQERVQAKDLIRHLQEDCTRHAEWLRMVVSGREYQQSRPCSNCAEMVKRSHLKLHMDYVCPRAKRACGNQGCGASIPRSQLAEHEQKFCRVSSAMQRRRRLANARARSMYYRGWAQDMK